jgi:hypothetical protein
VTVQGHASEKEAAAGLGLDENVFQLEADSAPVRALVKAQFSSIVLAAGWPLALTPQQDLVKALVEPQSVHVELLAQ